MDWTEVRKRFRKTEAAERDARSFTDYLLRIPQVEELDLNRDKSTDTRA